jgi:hypothetical protein
MKLYKKKDENEIHVKELKKNQIAVITKWSADYTGLIVQRFDESLHALGDAECTWKNLFSDQNLYDGCYVRILKKGTKLIV